MQPPLRRLQSGSPLRCDLTDTSTCAIRTWTSSPQNCHKRKSGWRHRQPQLFENNSRGVRREGCDPLVSTSWSVLVDFKIDEAKLFVFLKW